jgi:hypothetical protein
LIRIGIATVDSSRHGKQSEQDHEIAAIDKNVLSEVPPLARRKAQKIAICHAGERHV